MNNPKTSRAVIAGKEVSITTGVMAKQANGSVTIQCGNCILLATATMSKNPRTGIDFFPLSIEISEKMYAAGKIPGGFFKREARPSTQSTLTARLIDRPLRPSFPKNLHNDVQIIITVLSYDENVTIEPLAMVGASAALCVSDIPFNGPVGGVLVGQIDGQFVANPSIADLEKSDLNIIVAGTKDAILMVESESNEVSEETILDAIMYGHGVIKETITLQEELAAQASKPKQALPQEDPRYAGIEQQISEYLSGKIEAQMQGGNKSEIEIFLSDLEKQTHEEFIKEDDDETAFLVKKAYQTVKKRNIRQTIIKNKVRPDGRALDEVRAIDVQIGLLPSTHGSALFTRGETQSLGILTLGSEDDKQIVDGLHDSDKSSYYFHYNFPPFSVGETGFLRTGRRELGHGNLAERALKPVLPSSDAFPYTLRIVSEILESNGSSSMASVCSGSLSLMDCGVPITGQVSGIAMGLLLEDGEYTILSDIQGLEDHYGDMDFKVAGTQKGITALQLDIKVSGLSKEILTEALAQAKSGRTHILDVMNASIDAPRDALNANAPKIHSFNINPEKVGLVIGPGGKMIRKIEEESNANVVIADGDDGVVCVSAKNQADLDKAVDMITTLVKDAEVGGVYQGRVVKIMNFGAFVEIFPGKEGLVHISKLSKQRVEKVEDVVNVGDSITVKVDQIDAQKRINLVPVNVLD